MAVSNYSTHYEPEVEPEEPVLEPRPVPKRDTNYEARVREIKKKYPKILARLAE